MVFMIEREEIGVMILTPKRHGMTVDFLASFGEMKTL